MYRYVVQLCLCLAFAGLASRDAATESYVSPVAVVADHEGTRLYVAEFTAHQTVVFDLVEEAVKITVVLLEPLSGLTLSPDGTYL